MKRPSASVRDIASMAGVSAASVSRAMRDPDRVSDRTRALVRDALDRIEGDTITRARQGVATLGCLILDSTSRQGLCGFDASICGGLARATMNHGAQLLLMNVNRYGAEDTIPALLERAGVGALVVRLDAGSEGLLDEIAQAEVPTITVACKHDHPAIGYVCVESRATSRDAVKHLIHLGHHRIAFCRNVIVDQDHSEREAGYRDALAEHGIEAEPALSITVPADVDGGVNAVNRLLSLSDPPTAVYFADPLPTLGALRRLQELRVRVPEEFSVIGFDDDNTRELGCSVYTAVCQDAPGMAAMAGQLLCRSLQGKGFDVPPRIELDSYLEVNATTSARGPRGAV